MSVIVIGLFIIIISPFMGLVLGGLFKSDGNEMALLCILTTLIGAILSTSLAAFI